MKVKIVIMTDKSDISFAFYNAILTDYLFLYKIRP
jgi:hypothetical protein